MSFSEILLVFIVCLAMCLFVGTVVHELGHFCAAKWFTRILPTRLQLGGGPPVFVREGAIRFVVGWLPLGGMVAYAGEKGEPQVPATAVSWDEATHNERLVVAAGGPLFHAALFLTALGALLFVSTDARGLIWVSIVVNCIGQVALALLSLNLRNVSDGGHIYRALRRLPAAHSLGAWRYIAVAMWVAAVLSGALIAMNAAMAWHE
ncbi:site-2 protease family protein [Ensifer sp. B1-9]|uniref:site-2 protease family protein n=1 Tax=Ensifer sp. B1-9 TaxID=3141455 RepID=UPI003D2018CE